MASRNEQGHSLPPAILLMGPTAAGKTGVSLALVERFPVSLISVDSAQVYRGLDIGSAKPDEATLARYPHALIDIREPEQAYSAAEFAEDAKAEIEHAHRRGRMPLLVGGTTLYFRALLYGLDALPRADAELRSRIRAEAERRGWPALHAELAASDATAAAAIPPNDAQRIQRGLEILRLTGRGPSAHHSHNPVARLPTLRLVVTPPDRNILHKRIEKRLDAMLAAGFVEEVAGLRARGTLTIDHPAMRSVGYRQLWQHLDGAFSLREARERAVAATRQLAKRQLTALRKMQRTLWNDPLRKRTIDLIFRQVGDYLQWARGQRLR